MSEICCLKCGEMINDAQSEKKVCFSEGLLIISEWCSESSCQNVTTGVTISNFSLSISFAMTIVSQLLEIICVRQLKAHVEPRTLYMRLRKHSQVSEKIFKVTFCCQTDESKEMWPLPCRGSD